MNSFVRDALGPRSRKRRRYLEQHDENVPKKTKSDDDQQPVVQQLTMAGRRRLIVDDDDDDDDDDVVFVDENVVATDVTTTVAGAETRADVVDRIAVHNAHAAISNYKSFTPDDHYILTKKIIYFDYKNIRKTVSFNQHLRDFLSCYNKRNKQKCIENLFHKCYEVTEDAIVAKSMMKQIETKICIKIKRIPDMFLGVKEKSVISQQQDIENIVKIDNRKINKNVHLKQIIDNKTVELFGEEHFETDNRLPQEHANNFSTSNSHSNDYISSSSENEISENDNKILYTKDLHHTIKNSSQPKIPSESFTDSVVQRNRFSRVICYNPVSNSININNSNGTSSVLKNLSNEVETSVVDEQNHENIKNVKCSGKKKLKSSNIVNMKNRQLHNDLNLIQDKNNSVKTSSGTINIENRENRQVDNDLNLIPDISTVQIASENVESVKSSEQNELESNNSIANMRNQKIHSDLNYARDMVNSLRTSLEIINSVKMENRQLDNNLNLILDSFNAVNNSLEILNTVQIEDHQLQNDLNLTRDMIHSVVQSVSKISSVKMEKQQLDSDLSSTREMTNPVQTISKISNVVKMENQQLHNDLNLTQNDINFENTALKSSSDVINSLSELDTCNNYDGMIYNKDGKSEVKIFKIESDIRKIINTNDDIFKNPIINNLTEYFLDNDVLSKSTVFWEIIRNERINELISKIIGLFNKDDNKNNVVYLIGCFIYVFREILEKSSISQHEMKPKFIVFINIISKCVKNFNIELWNAWFLTSTFLDWCFVVFCVFVKEENSIRTNVNENELLRTNAEIYFKKVISCQNLFINNLKTTKPIKSGIFEFSDISDAEILLSSDTKNALKNEEPSRVNSPELTTPPLFPKISVRAEFKECNSFKKHDDNHQPNASKPESVLVRNRDVINIQNSKLMAEALVTTVKDSSTNILPVIVHNEGTSCIDGLQKLVNCVSNGSISVTLKQKNADAEVPLLPNVINTNREESKKTSNVTRCPVKNPRQRRNSISDNSDSLNPQSSAVDVQTPISTVKKPRQRRNNNISANASSLNPQSSAVDVQTPIPTVKKPRQRRNNNISANASSLNPQSSAADIQAPIPIAVNASNLCTMNANNSFNMNTGNATGINSNYSWNMNDSNSLNMNTDNATGMNSSHSWNMNASNSLNMNTDNATGINSSHSWNMNASNSLNMNTGNSTGINSSHSWNMNTGNSTGINSSHSRNMNASNSLNMNTGNSTGINSIHSWNMNASNSLNMNTGNSTDINSCHSWDMNASNSLNMNTGNAMGMNASDVWNTNVSNSLNMNTRNSLNMNYNNINNNTQNMNTGNSFGMNTSHLSNINSNNSLNMINTSLVHTQYSTQSQSITNKSSNNDWYYDTNVRCNVPDSYTSIPRQFAASRTNIPQYANHCTTNMQPLLPSSQKQLSCFCCSTVTSCKEFSSTCFRHPVHPTDISASPASAHALSCQYYPNQMNTVNSLSSTTTQITARTWELPFHYPQVSPDLPDVRLPNIPNQPNNQNTNYVASKCMASCCQNFHRFVCCQNARYCSVQCQQTDWYYHKNECSQHCNK